MLGDRYARYGDMKKRPAGDKSRNLYARGHVIYYESALRGRRRRYSMKTDDWETAAATRDVLEEKLGVRRLPVFVGDMPRFATFAKRYLDEAIGDLAATTTRDRASYLRSDGPLGSYFGVRLLDEITPAVIREWWSTVVMVQTDGRQSDEKAKARRWTAPDKTGRRYLDGLEGVLSYAVELGFLDASPVPAFRHTLRRRGRTKRARASVDPTRHIRPIETARDLAALVKAAEAESSDAHALVLLCLDAGLRLGEALGLSWGAIVWGADESDRSRALRVDFSRPRGGDLETTKSGRGRVVALSQRLRRCLAGRYREQFHPGGDALVLNALDPDNFRHREWRRICEAAGLGSRAIKDLRDTFASQLLTAGIPLGYVSEALGHADCAVTARHYARWIGGAEYRAPMALLTGEVPADLLDRIAAPAASTITLAAVKRPKRRRRIPSLSPHLKNESPRILPQVAEIQGLAVAGGGFEPPTFGL